MNDKTVTSLIEGIIKIIRAYTEPFMVLEEPKESSEGGVRHSITDVEEVHNTHSFSFRYVNTPSDRCKSVTMGKRVLTTLLAEAYANGDNETGGPFFGHIETDGNWYIVETTGPGFDALHTPTNHEMNSRFVNYQYRALSRIYANELTLVGFWHRHPGSFNRFSGLDDQVNKSYAEVIGNGTVSILLNFAADGPHLTGYYLDPDDGCYHRTQLIVDSKELGKKGFLTYAAPAELAMRADEMQKNMEGIA